MPDPGRRPLIQFLYPNLWQNWLSDDFRIVIAFAPIDAENTLMYIRSYQRVVKLPVLRELFNWVNALGNLVIERQDKRVVITQQPKRSDLRIVLGWVAFPVDSLDPARRNRVGCSHLQDGCDEWEGDVLHLLDDVASLDIAAIQV